MILDRLFIGEGDSAPSEPNFENVTLLLHGNGSNGAQNNTFLDSSTNNFTVTRNGETTQGSFSPYGDLWSNYFDGTGDYLTVADNAALELGASNFTIEAWVYLAVGGTTQTVIQKRNSGAVYNGYGLFITASNILGFIATSSGSSWEVLILNGTAMPIGQWNHVAVTRNGSTWKTWLNGIESASATSSITIKDSADSLGIGAIANGEQPINGHISNLRIVNGFALYTANFTPPTAPLTAIGGTSLLTCQSNRFRDVSANNFAVTAVGNAAISNFAPFNPNSIYSAATNGGSGYFDAIDDGLSVASNAAFAYGTGDFTWEAWIYGTDTDWATSTNYILDHGDNGGVLQVVNGQLRYYNPTTGVNSPLYTAGGSIQPREWVHIAASRQSGVTRVYVNGVLRVSGSDSHNYPTNTVLVGRYGGTFIYDFEFGGYISNLRIIKGTALYTSNFTPPNSPVTAISGTSLLLNFTNAGIVDASAKSNLTTIGNAQISTAQSKFGGGSMAFDGTGDYLTTPYNENFDLGSTYTIEAWVYPTTTSGFKVVFSIEATNATSFAALILSSNNGAAYFEVRPTTGGAVTSISGGSLSLNAWTHLAISVSNGSGKLFVNGTQVGSTTSIPNLQTRQFVGVGGNGNGFNPDGNSWVGYIDDLRVTKGIARYTSNFTPPTAPFADK